MPQASGPTRAFRKPEEVINPGLLEAIEFVDKSPQLITYDYPEFSAVCPFSGLPDVARVIIEMVPRRTVRTFDLHPPNPELNIPPSSTTTVQPGLIPELKALKMYFISYRDAGIYQEEATDLIFKHLLCKFYPDYLQVKTVYNTRGGLDTTAVVQYGDKEEALRWQRSK